MRNRPGDKTARAEACYHVVDQHRVHLPRSMGVELGAATHASRMPLAARRSARSFSGWPAWPFTQCHCTWCRPAAASRRRHRSAFLTGCLPAVYQPLLFHRGSHFVMPSRTYVLSVCTRTTAGRVRLLGRIAEIYIEKLGRPERAVKSYERILALEPGNLDAARALVPLAGPYAEILFAVGLFGASMLAAGVLPLATAYSISEAFGFEKGVSSSFREAPIFVGVFTFLVVLGAVIAMTPGLSLINILLVTQVVNGVLLPVILIAVLKLINDRELMGRQVNGPIYNAAAGLTTVIVSALSILVVLSSLFPNLFRR